MSQPAFQLVPQTKQADYLSGDGAWGTEAQCVKAARSNPDAFAHLYRQNFVAIARYIRHRVGDEHIANDLVAETFMAALENLHTYRDRGLPFRSWLFRIATSRVSRWARKLPKQRIASIEEAGEVEAGGEPASSALTEIARCALLSLPTRYQDTLSLHYLEGLSVEEVARALGSRSGTIKARLARGRELLRRKLAPYAEDLLR